ncbi:MAG: 4-(cytidine 5'-diphospho)-2-C-methyl-D-erythritol kinase [Planctomycetales bacterium]|nr:4-(cytidine 5'-diphospho)-2-C-methyl-D-erythritol kinase [Planctomycetales bacterium]
MFIRRISNTIHIQAPGKVNLFLDVLQRRSDGYHEIDTVLCPIGLFDELSFEPTAGKALNLQLDFPERQVVASVDEQDEASEPDRAWDIPSDQRNLVLRVVDQARQRLGIQSGANIRLVKRIPAAAGLGGGSSNAAAALVACLTAWHGWDRALATSIAADHGSDIPFFLGDERGIGLCRATGRGEVCEFFQEKPHLPLVVLHPRQGCSTAAIYELFGLQANDSDAPRKHPKSQKIIDACQNGQAQNVGQWLFNALQSSAEKHNRWVTIQLNLMRECGARHVVMSGSGSSCFALVADEHVRKQIVKRSKQMGIDRAYAVDSCFCPSVESQVDRLASLS